MALLRSGAICEIRRGVGDWRVIDERFDGHVNQYLLQSLNNGEITWRFRHEITEKHSSTYQELNDFLLSIANDFDDDIFEGNFDGVLDNQPEIQDQTASVPPEVPNSIQKRFKQVGQLDLNTLKASNTEATTNKQTKWAVKMLKGYYK